MELFLPPVSGPPTCFDLGRLASPYSCFGAYQVPESPVSGRTLAASNFKPAYDKARAPAGPMPLGSAIGQLLRLYCRKIQVGWAQFRLVCSHVLSVSACVHDRFQSKSVATCMAVQVAYDDAEGEDYFEQLNREAMENAQVRATRGMQQRPFQSGMGLFNRWLTCTGFARTGARKRAASKWSRFRIVGCC